MLKTLSMALLLLADRGGCCCSCICSCCCCCCWTPEFAKLLFASALEYKPLELLHRDAFPTLDVLLAELLSPPLWLPLPFPGPSSPPTPLFQHVLPLPQEEEAGVGGFPGVPGAVCRNGWPLFEPSDDRSDRPPPSKEEAPRE